jgi:paraquat-inducible protein A
MPLMHVEEWLFWDREYSIVSGTWELFAAGEVFLSLAVLVFVIVLPFVSFVTLMVLSIVPFTPPGRRLDSRHHLLDLLRAINKWSMFDVFALAVLVVITKIGGLASVEPRLGLWLFVSGALVSIYVSWKIG